VPCAPREDLLQGTQQNVCEVTDCVGDSRIELSSPKLIYRCGQEPGYLARISQAVIRRFSGQNRGALTSAQAASTTTRSDIRSSCAIVKDTVIFSNLYIRFAFTTILLASFAFLRRHCHNLPCSLSNGRSRRATLARRGITRVSRIYGNGRQCRGWHVALQHH
jgi:hypothetical protein